MRPLFLLCLSAAAAAVLAQIPGTQTGPEAVLENSIPYIGVDAPRGSGYDGGGIVVGVIDTGVDGSHPDLAGRVVRSYNLLDGGTALDTNGHGTGVAGVIAAGGALTGVAPGAEIISYKVSDDGESVSSDLIIRAIEQAVEDDVDVINISLGINRTNHAIDLAVDRAVRHGIVVVVAAGNDGPGPGTIGSPGLGRSAITVGATYNNLTSSLVATLEIDGRQFQVVPMTGSPASEVPVEGDVLFGQYGRERDLQSGGFAGAIILAERGSDLEDETVYFSDKERGAADAGAAALIVYNNEPGMYLGELVHEFVDDGYEPRIPTVSMSRQDGMEIRGMLGRATGALHVFYNPDFVAQFSSRGPVSPFYIKPDLVAPGAFVNTTVSGGGYNLTGGTSFATPHVSGTAALLLQKNPGLAPHEVRSILTTTADPVYDPYGGRFDPEAGGAGRLNATRAFGADLVVSPAHVILDLSPEHRSAQQRLDLRSIGGKIGGYEVSFDVPGADVRYERHGDSGTVYADALDGVFGRFYGTMSLAHAGTTYSVPVMIRTTQGAIAAYEDTGTVGLEVLRPGGWTYAKISVTHAETGSTDTISIRPHGRAASMPVYENGTYWIDAKIDADGTIHDAFSSVRISSAHGTPGIAYPERHVVIAAAVMAAVGAAGICFAIRNRNYV